MAEQINTPVPAPQQIAQMQPAVPAPSTQKPPNQSGQNPPEQPLISTTTLFIAGIFIAFLLIILGIFYMRNNFLSLTMPSRSSYTNSQHPDSLVTETPPTTTHQTLPVAPGWKSYTSEAFGYALQYPSEYRLETGEKGAHLQEKVALFESNHASPVIKLIVWDNVSETLEKAGVENWCNKTLSSEALQEKMLCAFMSSAALDDTDIDNHPAFTMNYYNSDSERVNFYIIPMQSKIITIHATSFLDSTKKDDGTSQAKKILETISF